MAQLEGIKVVELANYVAAPICGRVLANYGADVIKIEPLEGDIVRMIGGTFGYPKAHEDGDNPTFDIMNGSKRGISLDLKTEKGLEVLMKLIGEADVFLTNNRVKALKKLGLDYESLHKKFPRLIHASILGYGEAGPLKDKPGFDYTSYFSRGGISVSLMEKGTSPANPITGFGDNYAGLALSSGILAALYRQSKTGEGERVTVSLYDMGIFGVSTILGSIEYGSTLPLSRKSTQSALTTTYLTKDEKWIQIAVLNYDKQVGDFCKAADAMEIMEDERFNNRKAGTKNAGLMTEVLEDVFKKFTLAEWEERLTAADIPYEVLQTINDIANDEQAYANDYIYKKKQPDGKNIYYTRTPVFFTERPSIKDEEGRGRGPLLGEDTTDILTEIGYSPEEIAAMKDASIVKEDKR